MTIGQVRAALVGGALMQIASILVVWYATNGVAALGVMLLLWGQSLFDRVQSETTKNVIDDVVRPSIALLESRLGKGP